MDQRVTGEPSAGGAGAGGQPPTRSESGAGNTRGFRAILPIWLVVIALGAPPPCHAQLRGMPVHFTPSAQPGLRLFGDFAGGDHPFHTYVGGRASLNLALVTVNAGVGTHEGEITWGGSLSANVLRGAARNISLSVDAGLGVYDQEGVAQRDIPIGLGLAYEATVTGVDLEPWIGLRTHVRRTSVQTPPGTSSSTRVGAGISAGANVRSDFIKNFGVHAAVDYLTIAQPFGTGRDRTFLFNLGINYLIPWPGLPAHGIIPPSCSPFDPC